MKIRSVGAGFHVDGRTDGRAERDREPDKKKANSRFSQFLHTHLEKLAESILIKSNINNPFGRAPF
jgi:hypothetical protein